MVKRFSGLFARRARRGAALFFGAALPVLALVSVACNQQDLTPEQARIRQGRTLYTLRCASCHHPADPSRDGGVGPAIAGSSLELLEARVLRGEYPEGYTPKRATRVMQKLSATPGELEALHAFLNSH